MKNIFLHILCPLCVRCSSLRVEVSFFCSICEEEFLFRRLDIHERAIDFKNQKTSAKYLIRWRSGESDCLSEVVYLLKSGLSLVAWKYYSNILAKLIDIQSDKEKTFLVPVPSRAKRGSAYHTQYFSQFLSQFLGYPVLKCLKSDGFLQSQKSLNLHDRAGAKFEFCEEFTSSVYAAQRIIFVDDIITSGSTLKACHETLKPHLSRDCKIDIIALFSREKI